MSDVRYGILGHEIEYSLSPAIHNAAFNHLGIEARYELFDVPPGELESFMAKCHRSGVAGMNVTKPYKKLMLQHCTQVSPVVHKVGAVNTIARQPKGWYGNNTDVEGFLFPLRNELDRLANHNVAVFGAGGAARAVLYALASATRVTSIWVVARNERKARELALAATSWRTNELKVHPLALDNPKVNGHLSNCQLIVNATPVGSTGDEGRSPVPEGIDFDAQCIFYDLVYDPKETVFLSIGKKQGLRTIGGWDMLLAQAAASFKLWTGQEMPMDIVRSSRPE